MKNKKQLFDPEDFPALEDFLSAYLHEDFGEDYGSAAGAAEAFFVDASGDEIRDVKEEWRKLRKALSGIPFGEIGAALGRLGSSWSPANEQEWKAFDEILSRPEA